MATLAPCAISVLSMLGCGMLRLPMTKTLSGGEA